MDDEIIRLLTENGGMPIGEMPIKLNVTGPTIWNRIKDLEKNGVFKVDMAAKKPKKHKSRISGLVISMGYNE